MTKAKALTAAGKKALGAELAALVDVYRPGREWREEAAIVRETIRCVWRAATLYGRARVERELAAIAKDNAVFPGECSAWRECFARWLNRKNSQLVPVGVLRDAYVPWDCLAPRLTLARRVA